jgi:hypothetical protein
MMLNSEVQDRMKMRALLEQGLDSILVTSNDQEMLQARRKLVDDTQSKLASNGVFFTKGSINSALTIMLVNKAGKQGKRTSRHTQAQPISVTRSMMLPRTQDELIAQIPKIADVPRPKQIVSNNSAAPRPIFRQDIQNNINRTKMIPRTKSRRVRAWELCPALPENYLYPSPVRHSEETDIAEFRSTAREIRKDNIEYLKDSLSEKKLKKQIRDLERDEDEDRERRWRTETALVKPVQSPFFELDPISRFTNNLDSVLMYLGLSPEAKLTFVKILLHQYAAWISKNPQAR